MKFNVEDKDGVVWLEDNTLKSLSNGPLPPIDDKDSIVESEGFSFSVYDVNNSRFLTSWGWDGEYEWGSRNVIFDHIPLVLLNHYDIAVIKNVEDVVQPISYYVYDPKTKKEFTATSPESNPDCLVFYTEEDRDIFIGKNELYGILQTRLNKVFDEIKQIPRWTKNGESR